MQTAGKSPKSRIAQDRIIDLETENERLRSAQMDWHKVIDKLRWFGKNSEDSATAIVMEYGKHERFIHHKERSDLYFTLAAALEAGLKKCKN